MIRSISIVLLGLSLVLVIGCSKESIRKANEKVEQEQQAQLLKNEQQECDVISRNIIYFQDKRTGLCFAYYWGGSYQGGPALTLVPRDKVEQFLVNK
jgi:hypothetical protein